MKRKENNKLSLLHESVEQTFRTDVMVRKIRSVCHRLVSEERKRKYSRPLPALMKNE